MNIVAGGGSSSDLSSAFWRLGCRASASRTGRTPAAGPRTAGSRRDRSDLAHRVDLDGAGLVRRQGDHVDVHAAGDAIAGAAGAAASMAAARDGAGAGSSRPAPGPARRATCRHRPARRGAASGAACRGRCAPASNVELARVSRIASRNAHRASALWSFGSSLRALLSSLSRARPNTRAPEPALLLGSRAGAGAWARPAPWPWRTRRRRRHRGARAAAARVSAPTRASWPRRTARPTWPKSDRPVQIGHVVRLGAAHEVLGADHRRLGLWPSSSTTGTSSQPSAGRLPDSRQTCDGDDVVGRHQRLRLVAARSPSFMKSAHSGTATSPA